MGSGRHWTPCSWSPTEGNSFGTCHTSRSVAASTVVTQSTIRTVFDHHHNKDDDDDGGGDCGDDDDDEGDDHDNVDGYGVIGAMTTMIMMMGMVMLNT